MYFPLLKCALIINLVFPRGAPELYQLDLNQWTTPITLQNVALLTWQIEAFTTARPRVRLKVLVTGQNKVAEALHDAYHALHAQEFKL